MGVFAPSSEAAVLDMIDADARVLVRNLGTEDHQEILWVSFSDDGGITRIVCRAYEHDARRAFAILKADDLLAGLSEARAAGQDKEYWDIDLE